MERLRAYWLELSVRERQIVLGGAIAVLVMVLYAVTRSCSEVLLPFW